MQYDDLDRIYLGGMISFLAIALSAFLSMRVGAFSVGVVGMALVLVLVAMAGYRRTMGRDTSSGSQAGSRSNRRLFSPANIVLPGLLLSAGLLYGLFPTYYLLGGRDPGLYLVFSAHIANTGELILDLPVLRDLLATYGDVIRLGFPGIYSAYARGLSNDPAELIPQFMHLFPAIGAIFYQLAGLEGLVRSNAVIAVFALWSFSMVARRLVGPPAALLATLALALNAAFIWNARITLTEALAVALLFSGLYLLIRAFDLKSALWAAASGAVLGLAVLNRLDSALNVLIILGAAGVAFFRPIDFRIVVLPLIGAYLVFSTWGFFDGYVHSFPYYYDLWERGSLKGLVYLNYGALILAILAFRMRNQWPFKRVYKDFLVDRLLRVTVILLGAWILFALFLWPTFDDRFNARAIGELAWYVTPVMFAVFVYGLWHAISMKDRHPIVVPLIIMGVCVLFLFTWRPTITPDHIWASRRWVPQVIPLLILFAAMGLQGFLVKGAARLAKGTAVAALMIYYVGASLTFASPYLFQSMMADARKGYDSIVSGIGEYEAGNPVALTVNAQLASVLTYVYGIETVLTRDYGLELRGDAGQMDGRLWLGFDSLSRGELLHRASVEGLFLEKKRGQKPQDLYVRSYNANLGIIDTTDPVRFRSVPTEARFSSMVGILDKEKDEVRSSGRRGVLLFGPYIPVESGTYRVTWRGELIGTPGDSREVGFVDVAYGKGSEIVARARVVRADLRDGVVGEIEFVLPKAVDDLEYRYHVNDGVDMRISEVWFEQIGDAAHVKAYGGPVRLGIGTRGAITRMLPGIEESLGAGWHAVEQRHVWSTDRAELTLQLDENCREGGCVLLLGYRVMAPSDERPVEIRVSTLRKHEEGISRASIITEEGLQEIHVPVRAEDLDHDDRIVLAVQVQGAVSPRSLGSSEDPRVLGIALEEIGLHSMDDPALCRPPACLHWAVRDLDGIATQVGRVGRRAVETDGRAGYMLYGPYRPMQSGEYRLRLWGEARNAEGVVVDVVASKGSEVFARFEALDSVATEGVLLEREVFLDRDVTDLEVRVFVGVDTELRIRGYELRPDAGRVQ